MPILESIQISEQKAESLRANARKEVEDLLEKANDENQKLEKDMLADAKNKVQKIRENSEQSLKQMQKQVELDQEKKNEADFKNAESKMGKAIEFIINKVITS